MECYAEAKPFDGVADRILQVGDAGAGFLGGFEDARSCGIRHPRLAAEEAFGEIVRRHRDRLWAVALRTLGDREEAADAVQDALVSALRASGPRPDNAASTSAAGFRGESAVTTWLHRIVVNACLDRIRRRQAHPTVPLPDGSHSDGPPTGPEPAESAASAPSSSRQFVGNSADWANFPCAFGPFPPAPTSCAMAFDMPISPAFDAT